MTGRRLSIISSESEIVEFLKNSITLSLEGGDIISLGIKGRILKTEKTRRPKDISITTADDHLLDIINLKAFL